MFSLVYKIWIEIPTNLNVKSIYKNKILTYYSISHCFILIPVLEMGNVTNCKGGTIIK